MSGPTRRVFSRLRGGGKSQTGSRSDGSGRRKPQRGTPPDAVGRGPLVSAPGLLLAIVVPVRNEAPYLEEWLAYHHALGVQHFFIYDNGSDDDLQSVVERWVNHGLVTVVHWPLPGGQLDAYSHALRFFGAAVEWLAFVDVDEFIVPLVDDDLHSLLARWPDAADVRIPRVDFGFSGHREPPDGLTIEAYTEVADVFARDPSKPQRVKSIVRPRGVSAMGIHTATLADASADAAGAPSPSRSIGRQSREFAQVNHYYTRSFAEFEAKRVRGSATGRQDRPAVAFDLPAQRIDTSAHRHIERTREAMKQMRSLAASPYHYGSQLALEQFPHYNDLGLFGEFAVANTVAGEPALRREPRTRMENLYDGIGFIGDIGAFDFEPERGSLSGSMHLGPLLERARAEVVASWAAPDGQPTVAAGELRDADGGWRITPSAGTAEVTVDISDLGERRCYAVGFVIAVAGAAWIELEVVGADGPAAAGATVVQLPARTTYAGIVEIAADPCHAVRACVRPGGDIAGMSIYDLFLISYG